VEAETTALNTSIVLDRQRIDRKHVFFSFLCIKNKIIRWLFFLVW